jgi:hypothetical protein
MSDHVSLREQLDTVITAKRLLLYTSLTRDDKFELFSCSLAQERIKNFMETREEGNTDVNDPNSLEAIHDDYHVFLGGPGGNAHPEATHSFHVDL